jgi:hypothetical protein
VSSLPSAAARSNSSRAARKAAARLAHGFPAALLVELVRYGLVNATVGQMMAGDRAIYVTEVQITEAGRQALGA